jgi:peptidyl-Asp metalloendopeptidase
MKLLKNSAITALVLSGLYGTLQADQLFESVPSKMATATESSLLSQKGVQSVSTFKANMDMLTADLKSFELKLKDGVEINVSKFAAHTNPQGSLVWKGKVVDSAGMHIAAGQDLIDDSVIFVKTARGITGTVRVDGQLYKIMPGKNGTHNVMEMNDADMPEEHPPEAIQALESESQFDVNHYTNMLANVTPNAAAADMKVLVAYTSSAKNATSDINGLIQLAVAETNTGYSNSGINATMSLVHSYQVNYTEVGHQTDRDRFKGTNDGYMDEVHGKRDQYGADIAVIVLNRSEYCGIAAAIGATSSTAFATVHHSCATGYYSFGHEVGHLLGARHDPGNDPTTTPYAFGHGYQYAAGGWRTVMAYNCSGGCTRINWWSNPNNTRSGVAMGTSSQSDNARVLNITTPTAAGFKGGSTPPPTGGAMANGQAKTGLSGSTGTKLNFYLDVPAGATGLNFAMSGGTGDADLYVKFGSAPTTSSYDCRPYKGGNTESCPISSAQAGRYYVMLNGYSAFSGVSLTGSYTEGGGPVGGTYSQSNLSGSKNSWKHYSISVPAGMSSLAVNISGGSGDADVYVRRGAQPTSSTYDCRPWKSGNTESCSFNNPASGTWYISINGYSSYSGVNLSASWNP